MSRVVYFDAASGASGDMLLGALVDLGLPLDTLRGELAKLKLTGFWLEARRVERSGLVATKVDVRVEGGHDHEHEHDHEHDHDHGPGPGPGPGPGHRGLREIRTLIEASALAAPVRQRTLGLFERLAEAEAAVHGTAAEDVHFHEVGAVDSIVDIVGGVIGLTWLEAERFVCSPLNLGTGTVTMSHGTFPVPAPATARLVRGVPVYAQGVGELLTPTGALLLTAFADEYGALPPMRPERVGYGAGERDTPGRANVLRLLVGEAAGEAPGDVLLLECQLDDAPPQLLGPVVERALGAGALDAWLTPIQMKKGRPGVLVSVLCAPAQREALEEQLFCETPTLGVRRSAWQRTTLDREQRPVDTPYGPIRIKLGRRGDRVYNAQPEFEDCRAAAEAAGVPVKEVWAAAQAASRALVPGSRGAGVAPTSGSKQ